MADPLPFTSFTFQFEDVQSADAPEFVYSVRQASDFEACRESGFKKGVILIMKNQINGSPQGVGSRWIITDYRLDIDRITVQPLGSKSGCTAVRQLTLACLKADFNPVGFRGYRGC